MNLSNEQTKHSPDGALAASCDDNDQHLQSNMNSLNFLVVSDKHKDEEHLPKHPYCCTECTKTFSRPSRLRNHERNHTGERPYV